MKQEVSLVIAKGNAAPANSGIVHRYVGVAPVYVLAVNPDKATLENIYSTPENKVTLDKEPSYYDVDEEGVKTARINFLVQTNPDLCGGVVMKTPVSYYLRDTVRYNRDKTKVQLINIFGETAWVDVSVAETGKLPDSFKWFDTTGCRPALAGEEDLIKFIKAFAAVPVKSFTDEHGTVRNIPDLTAAYCQLDKIKNYFDGDITELVSLVEACKDHMTQILFGVKTTPDNKQYQDAYIQYPMKASVSSRDRLSKSLKESKDFGRYPNTYFGEEPFVFAEYKPQATDLKTEVAEAPAEAPSAGWWKA